MFCDLMGVFLPEQCGKNSYQSSITALDVTVPVGETDFHATYIQDRGFEIDMRRFIRDYCESEGYAPPTERLDNTFEAEQADRRLRYNLKDVEDDIEACLPRNRRF